MKPKSVKRREAQARQEAYNKLTPMQKLEKLDEQGMIASKQRGKILKQIGETINE